MTIVASALEPIYAGKLERYSFGSQIVDIDIAELKPGCHQFDDYLVRVGAPNKVDWVVSRICDHNSGKLILARDGHTAWCPLHGWKLDLDRLEYTNVMLPKETCEFSQHGSVITVTDDKLAVRFPASVLPDTHTDTVVARFISHACVEFDFGGMRLVTDPWLLGSAFLTGWWLASPPPRALIERTITANAMYISHTHSDHLHGDSLSLFRRDIPIIFPNFESGSIARRLTELGFSNLHPLDFNECYRMGNICLSILKSGDFEEDSGLYFATNAFSALLTVDSKRLNNLVLPRDVDLMMTSFAGGASGYPVCFETLSTDAVDRIAMQRKNGRPYVVKEYINATLPRVYAPYAGFFLSAASRDREIERHNHKMGVVELFGQLERSHPAVTLWNVQQNPVATFSDKSVTFSKDDRAAPPIVETQPAIENMKMEAADFDLDAVANYFRGSKFRDTFVLYLMVCDSDFHEIGDGLIVDFSGGAPDVTVMPPNTIEAAYDAAEDTDGLRRKRIKIRKEVLWQLVKHCLPWEEAMIGFQCRFKRKPDVYNHRFWNYFSKVFA